MSSIQNVPHPWKDKTTSTYPADNHTNDPKRNPATYQDSPQPNSSELRTKQDDTNKRKNCCEVMLTSCIPTLVLIASTVASIFRCVKAINECTAEDTEELRLE